MKRLVVNIVAIAVIGMGGFALAQPAVAQDYTTAASCEQDGKVLHGDRCSVINGNCTCWDVEQK